MKYSKIVILIMPLAIIGCGDKNRAEAVYYNQKAVESLVKQGICENPQDCSKRNMVFWSGAKPWDETTYVMLYGISNPQAVDAVADSLRLERKKLMPGVTIKAYKSLHGQPNEELKEITIE